MDYRNPNALVETGWLAEHLKDARVRVLDATFHLPTAKRDARAEFEHAHVPGAAFFDVDRICLEGTDLPHMLPTAEDFGRAVGALGIGNGDRVVVYDTYGGPAAAARVWWTFRVFGHDEVAVLNGGWPKWLAEGRPTESGRPSPKPTTFRARKVPGLVRSVEQMLANVASRHEQVVDARTAGRFAGTEPEPRPGLKAGHVPGSRNLPFGELIDAGRNRVMRPADDIAAAFRRAGVDLAKPIVTTCGSGVTAAFLSFGLYLVGHDRAAVYDGSWAEWGGRADTPVER